MLKIRGGKLVKVVKAGYGQSMHSDTAVLGYNPRTDTFEGRVWNGRFGPGDNTQPYSVTPAEAKAGLDQDIYQLKFFGPDDLAAMDPAVKALLK